MELLPGDLVTKYFLRIQNLSDRIYNQNHSHTKESSVANRESSEAIHIGAYSSAAKARHLGSGALKKPQVPENPCKLRLGSRDHAEKNTQALAQQRYIFLSCVHTTLTITTISRPTLLPRDIAI